MLTLLNSSLKSTFAVFHVTNSLQSTGDVSLLAVFSAVSINNGDFCFCFRCSNAGVPSVVLYQLISFTGYSDRGPHTQNHHRDDTVHMEHSQILRNFTELYYMINIPLHFEL